MTTQVTEALQARYCPNFPPQIIPATASPQPSLQDRSSNSSEFSALNSVPQTKAGTLPPLHDGHIKPHGGLLSNLMHTNAKDKGDLLKECNGRVLALSDRGACDVELLMNGGFSPLEGFMNQETYKHVVLNARLPNGTLFGLPVVLDTMDEFLKPGQKVALEYKARVLAVLEIDSKWIPDKPLEAYHCYGSTLLEHPGVQMICMERGKYYLGGNVYGLELPARDIPCATPSEVRAQLPKNAVSSIARCPPQDD
ncbi:hypothetical protein CYMTET_43393 [Cymbomonas tetramitiformis]|uniref:ATP-sulfurylase PUA-like domain-containing protein n=1 Tax=Cymbomonas tetramitiformis TaxID=36881 RepID=A0AAE0F0N9_9CHLO|nr:hypothetical protein CYMTET_43393 [Cymbomonas tetramitiformis]